MTAPTSQRRGSYGFDAPPVMVLLGGLALGFLAGAVADALVGDLAAAGVLVLIGLAMAAQFGLFLHATRRGKFRAWDGLLDELRLRGDERLLDLGCGRGAVLLAAAKRLPEGKAVGIDLWRSVDQSGNSSATTEQNAVAEQVADRVELHTGDITSLPFRTGEFDVVVSSLVIHNIKSAAGRAAAVREALRVLRPGGHLVLVDIGRTGEYETTLVANGAQALRAQTLGWQVWWGGPWLPTRTLSATAPPTAA
ncbi:methyltransferase domain-containing protein [Nocardia brasiliensis]|uniref:Methyltransferase domain-containing protein n=1 Tax=Nocardia brasiliensis TaxID=37326 RepID=A0A6G9XWB8_NOCBR|nr:class I SAM-dependent methyltransferase [Nocardia brasiliensis]QIS05232.1 methyltransferase domain-containing protein [Nocardia brasiliensis]